MWTSEHVCVCVDVSHLHLHQTWVDDFVNKTAFFDCFLPAGKRILNTRVLQPEGAGGALPEGEQRAGAAAPEK